MTPEEVSPVGHGLPKARIEALTDGIFAVAMTVLVLDIKVPIIQEPIAVQLPRKLLALWPQCLSYVISFVMLGIYWVGQHNQFHLIRRTDRMLLWINILFMMTICFVPFSTAVLSSYPGQPVSLVVYGANLIAIGLLLQWHWSHATHRHRLVDATLDSHLVQLVSRRIRMGPALFLLAIAAAFVSTTLSLVLYSVAPLLYILPGKVDQHWSEPRAAHRR